MYFERVVESDVSRAPFAGRRESYNQVVSATYWGFINFMWKVIPLPKHFLGFQFPSLEPLEKKYMPHFRTAPRATFLFQPLWAL